MSYCLNETCIGYDVVLPRVDTSLIKHMKRLRPDGIHCFNTKFYNSVVGRACVQLLCVLHLNESLEEGATEAETEAEAELKQSRSPKQTREQNAKAEATSDT